VPDPQRRPLWPADRIAADLRGQIASGELAPGQQLPTVVQLCDSYGVAKVTTLRALSILRREGLIYTDPGSAPSSGIERLDYAERSDVERRVTATAPILIA
jgi:DNA-binding transcriptional regulator YhcF (GntR family)